MTVASPRLTFAFIKGSYRIFRCVAKSPSATESTSTVSVAVAPWASVTTTEQMPASFPDLTEKVAVPDTGVALVATSCATNGSGTGEAELEGLGVGAGAQLIAALNAAVSPVSLTVNGAVVGAPASNVNVAMARAGVGTGVGLGDGVAVAPGDGVAVALGDGVAVAPGDGVALARGNGDPLAPGDGLEVGVMLATGSGDELEIGPGVEPAETLYSATRSGTVGVMTIAPVVNGNETVVPVTFPGPSAGATHANAPLTLWYAAR